jgi:hypothetical protein
MRKTFSLVLVIAALLLGSVTAPASAMTGGTPTRRQLQHIDDVPASAIASVSTPSGGFYTYWLANGFLYRNYIEPNGSTGPVAYMGEAIQLPGVTPKLELKTNAAGDIAVTYTCGQQSYSSLCVYVAYANKLPFSRYGLVYNVEDFSSAWTGNKFSIVASTRTDGLNPFDAPRTALSHVTIDDMGQIFTDSSSGAWMDRSVAQFNASKISIATSGADTLFAWESYESVNNSLEYVVRATVMRGGVTYSTATSRIVARLGNERVRKIGTSWLQGADGLLPSIMWVTDSQVATAAETSLNVWTAGSSVTLAGQALLADVKVTDQAALYAVVKTRHLTTPVLSSFTLTDTRLPLVETTVMANALTVSDLTAYQVIGSNPAVVTCTATGTNLIDVATGATIHAWTALARCGYIEIFDHAGYWLMFGIGTDYSTTQNSPHALQWIDTAAPIDLSPSNGRIIDQDMVAAGGKRAVAYIVRDWVDPVSSSLTHDRLLVQSPQQYSNGLRVLSNPLKGISNLHLLETTDHKVVALWQESESTLFSTLNSEVKASVFDPVTDLWTTPVVATSPGNSIITLGAVAEGGAGRGQAGSTVLMSATFCTSSPCSFPLNGLLSFDPSTLAFTVLGADAAAGAPALAAAQLGNGATAWIYASDNTNFEPWLYVRSASGSWSTGVPLASPSVSSLSPLTIVPTYSSGPTGFQGAVVYGANDATAPLGRLQSQRLDLSGGAPTLGAPIVIAANASLDGGAIFDASNTLHTSIKTGAPSVGFEHHFARLGFDNVVAVGLRYTRQTDVAVSSSADALGRVGFIWNDSIAAHTWQPSNTSATQTQSLGAASHIQSLAVVADADGITLNALWFHELNMTNLDDSAIWTQTLSQIGIGRFEAPTLRTAHYTSLSTADFEFYFDDNDSLTRLQYRPTPGSQPFALGDDADGIFTISNLDLTKPMSIDVRRVENFGTAYEFVGDWATFAFGALDLGTMSPPQPEWVNATTARLVWYGYGPIEDPYQFELTVTQAGKTRVFNTTAGLLEVTGLVATKPMTFTLRSSLYGVWGKPSALTTLAAAVAPNAPRNFSVKKVGTTIALGWQQPPFLGTFRLAGYRVEMRIGAAAWKVVAAKSTANSWVLKKPLKGKKYSFRVITLTALTGAPSGAKTLTWRG